MSRTGAEQILARARAAQPAWAGLPVAQRCTMISAMRRAIAREADAIASDVARETGKPLLDALSGDVLVTLEHLRYCESEAACILRPRKIRRSPVFYAGTRFDEYREPHGVVLIFAPSNYPLQLSLIPAVTALVTGNAVILKCSELTPETASIIIRLCAQAGFPSGLIQVIHEDAEAAAALIDAGPDFIFFTGSSRNGQQVAMRAARHLIPALLELGGKDAALVFADCHLDRAVEGVTYGAFCNGGRVCVGIRRVYVEASISQEFLTRLAVRIAQLRVAAGAESDLFPAPAGARPALRAQVEDALTRGATLLCPHDPSAAGEHPTLLLNVPLDAPLLTEESFGPVLCVQPFHDEAEAVALANNCAFALGSSIWTGDRKKARRVAAKLSAGSCAVNDVIRNVGNPWAAFGGNRRSGYGRYRGAEGLRALTRVKSLMLAKDRRAREIHWFPFRARTARRLAALLKIRHGSGAILAQLSRMLLLLLTLTAASAIAQKAPATTHLAIRVHLTAHARGELGYLIFAAPSGFPGDAAKALRHGFLSIPPGAQQLTIDAELPPGTYAVSVYEDLNGNRRLDHNFLGIPREPVGVSGNPPPRYGPPRFGECSFRVGSTPRTIEINMVHGL